MNRLDEHLKYIRNHRRLRAGGRLTGYLAWVLVVGAFCYGAFLAAPHLNANAGAATAVLTAALILITAYYAWWTRRLVGVEERRRIEDARPLLFFQANSLIYAPLEQTEGLNCLLHLSLSSQNAIATNVHVRVDIPVQNPDEASVRYLKAKPAPAFHRAIAPGDEVPLELSCPLKANEMPTRKSTEHFVVLNVACEDRLQNYYQHCAYFQIYRTETNPASREPLLIRRYEETRFIPVHKRSLMLTDDFGFLEPHLDAVEVLVQRRRG